MSNGNHAARIHAPSTGSLGPKADGNYDAAANRVESIPTFAMAALAGIGTMPDTIEDRAVIVRMRRRAPGETVAPYRHRRDRPALREFANELHAWLRAHHNVLDTDTTTFASVHSPRGSFFLPTPGAGGDLLAARVEPCRSREARTSAPSVVERECRSRTERSRDRARAAVLALTTEAAESGSTSDRIRLLVDCYAAIGDEEAIPTTTLLQRLKLDPEAPWAGYGPGHQGLTPASLAGLLREYDVRSTTIRFPGVGQAKGYHRAAFLDSWHRYTPAVFTTAEGEAVPAVSPQVSPGTAPHAGMGSSPSGTSFTAMI
jgi:hypothetical protein